MSKWIYISVIMSAVAVLAAVIVIMVSRRRSRRLLRSLQKMLDLAIDEKFTEHTFDESELSAVETKMVRYLSSHAMTSEKLRLEKDKINSLISDISHQTKTPIANVLLYAELLRELEMPGDYKKCTEALSAQAVKLDFLISSLVKASRLEAGIITVRAQRGKVQELINAAVESIRPKADKKNIFIQVNSTDGMADYDPK
ncbi:MAG: HAMP domain-containing histidine kinase, partial [Smithella sp.]|nr:HAMP domain-containing histidine kinase [Smithella sp.]